MRGSMTSLPFSMLWLWPALRHSINRNWVKASESHFYADSMHAEQFRYCRAIPKVPRDVFLDRDPRNTVGIDWSRAHQDIKGNERANELAKADMDVMC
ncbi:hypothetical protein C8R43DRAFT_1016066 [Mycena crocata]|nr:hypothetical protein C8R43DRAFT_1016066 [Mycena crocata]